MAGLGACDLVEKLSAQLPLFTLCEILGVPQADQPKFITWMHYLEVAGYRSAKNGAATPQPTPELLKFVQAFNDNVRRCSSMAGTCCTSAAPIRKRT